MNMVETSGYAISYRSEIIKSSLHKIQFSGEEINGTLNKSNKNVHGVLTIGNDFPLKYTYTISIDGKITTKNNIEGKYESDTRQGTFTITTF